MKKLAITLATLVAMMGAAQAQTQAPAPTAIPVRMLIGMGLSVGGDKLASAKYTDGGSQTISAGGGVYFTAGADFGITEQFSVQTNVNFHVDDTDAKNGSIKFQRFPVELLGFFHPNKDWAVGGGVRYVSGAKLSSSGAASGISASFDNTTSGIFEVEHFWDRGSVKVRYVKESFKSPGFKDTNASHVGISANYYF